jgi:hypothetical protein
MGTNMASALSAQVLLASLNENVEELTAAVDKMAAAAQQLSKDQAEDQKKDPATPKPATLAAGQ